MYTPIARIDTQQAITHHTCEALRAQHANHADAARNQHSDDMMLITHVLLYGPVLMSHLS